MRVPPAPPATLSEPWGGAAAASDSAARKEPRASRGRRQARAPGTARAQTPGRAPQQLLRAATDGRRAALGREEGAVTW